VTRGESCGHRGARGARGAWWVAAATIVVATIAPRNAFAQLPNLIEGSAQYMPGVALEDPRASTVG
jgi:hypothetical protein